jgi:outer membrane protein OmpA-like peptidoglycan-associated protein
LIILRRRYLLLLLTLALGCAQKRQALFVVLPNENGTSGAITVSDNSQKSVLLDKPYAASEEKGDSVGETTTDAQQVQQVFGDALHAQPILPEHHVLLFPNNSTVVAQISRQDFILVYGDIKRRPVCVVEVIGYTDTTGKQDYNQSLSLKRAEAIRDQLIKQGIDAKSISVAGRGWFDLAVPTGPNVSEQKNRRVEITVR